MSLCEYTCVHLVEQTQWLCPLPKGWYKLWLKVDLGTFPLLGHGIVYHQLGFNPSCIGIPAHHHFVAIRIFIYHDITVWTIVCTAISRVRFVSYKYPEFLCERTGHNQTWLSGMHDVTIVCTDRMAYGPRAILTRRSTCFDVTLNGLIIMANVGDRFNREIAHGRKLAELSMD